MNAGAVRSWILQQLPASMRPPLRWGYQLARDLGQAARTRRTLLNAERVTWLRPEVADLVRFRLLEPGRGEVLVRIHASVISPGTERAFLLGLPNTKASFPTVPGYSCAGVVQAVGKNVNGLRPGDRVAGVANHASHALIKPELLVHIPPGVSDEDAAFVELGVIALQGVRRAAIEPGERVVVLGLGLIGQLALQLARWAGAAPIIAVSRSTTFHATAIAGGADEVLDLGSQPASAPELQADVVLEATGSPAAISTAMHCARRGGRVVLLGSSRGITTGIDFERHVSERDLTIIGAHITSIAAHESVPGRWTRHDEAKLFLDLVAAKHVDLHPLITQRVSPAEANRVYDDLVAQRSAAVGIVFDWKTPRRQPMQRLDHPVRGREDKTVRQLRVALVGCGEISAHNAAGIRASQNCSLVQVMDLNEPAAQSLGRQFGVPHTTDLQSVWSNPGVDAVVIAVPHNLHAAIAIQAAEAGKHVIVEKPIATTLSDAEAMIHACERAKVALSVLFAFRYQPHILRARELVQAGALGTIVGTSIQFATEKPAGYWGQGYTGRVLTDWRGSWEKCGGGVLIMNVCHTLDYFWFVTGCEVEQVSSEFSTLNSPVEVEDIIAVSMRYQGGAIGSIHAATLARGDKIAEERIWGTHGTLVLAPGPPQIYTMRKVAGLKPGVWQQLGKFPKSNHVAIYMDRFAADVLAGRAPEVTGQDGRENLAVILAAYEAGREGRAIRVQSARRSATEAQVS